MSTVKHGDGNGIHLGEILKQNVQSVSGDVQLKHTWVLQ